MGWVTIKPKFNAVQSGVPVFVEHRGNNLQFYPNFAQFSTIGRMNLDHNLFQVSKVSEDQKKRSSTKKEHFFPPNSKWRFALRCTLESNYWGDADVDHTQIVGGIQSNYWGRYIPHPPRVSAPLRPAR